jgi:hypothetical protein
LKGEAVRFQSDLCPKTTVSTVLDNINLVCGARSNTEAVDKTQYSAPSRGISLSEHYDLNKAQYFKIPTSVMCYKTMASAG